MRSNTLRRRFELAFLPVWCFAFVPLSLSAHAEEPRAPAEAFSQNDLDFFERRVRPLLVSRCYECHSSRSEKLRGGLKLDSRDNITRGGDSGPAAKPKHVDESLLVTAIRYDNDQLQMPPAGKLPDAEVAVFVEWVQRGVPFPQQDTPADVSKSVDMESRKKHWAFQPLTIRRPQPESNSEFSTWPHGRIDQYVLEGQLRNGLHPSELASKRTLIRRAKTDLLGMPPTQEEVTDFVEDGSVDAYEKQMDAFLSSPQYGERWGRYWLDLARYCDVPEQWRVGKAKAWLYRDWVVQAMNRDMPYPEFVRQQLAGDLLPNADPADHAALGFLGLSPVYWKELKLDHLVIQQVVAEEWEERIDAMGSTFLGLTLACARCHDHKFDPVTTRDYYALAGVLASIQLEEQPIIADDLAAVAKKGRDQIQDLEKQVEKILGEKPPPADREQRVAELRKQMEEIRRGTPHLETPLAFGVFESSMHILPDGPHHTKIEYRPNQPQDVAVQIRGNSANVGEVIPRRFISVFARDSNSTFHQGSGRLELVDAIFSDAAPLAARVFVNRVWKHHFGRGLVETPSNFGIQGERPTHPELLDDLASRFIENDWSLKWLHREIMLSATYRQVSSIAELGWENADSNPQSMDPENRWLSRMPLRRLDVEAWRDGMLAATGELNLRLGGESELAEGNCVRRTLYCTVKRRELSDIFRLYDFPDPVAHSEGRQATTTPLQQLFVLNSPFMRTRCEALVARLDAQKLPDRDARIRCLYGWLFAREPSNDEIRFATEFLAAAQQDGTVESDAWKQYAHVLLGSNEMLFVE